MQRYVAFVGNPVDCSDPFAPEFSSLRRSQVDDWMNGTASDRVNQLVVR